MKLIFISLLLTTTFISTAQNVDTVRHNVVRLGKIVGKHLSWKKGSNDYYYYFEFNDRGRGPAITTHSKTDSKGNIIFQEITGVDYFKTKVEEKFEAKAGKARGQINLKKKQCHIKVNYIIISMAIQVK